MAGGVTTVYTYTYDDNGNILSISDGTNTTSYVYDSANQLTRENNQAGGFTHTWTYDNAGNILSRSEYAYTTGELGTALDTVTYTYGDENWGDLLTAYDGTAITTDEIGNMLTDGTWSYSWKHGRQLASMSNGTDTWQFTYNADGLRTKKTNGTTTYNYVYSGTTLTHLTVGNDALHFSYGADGRPMTVTHNETVYYYATNLQGDVEAILDVNGNAVVTYTYDAWGNPLTTTGSLASTLGTVNPLRYRGYVYDWETGLYYVSSRYYNPKIGRWVNADIPETLNIAFENFAQYNLFVYCFDNPVNMTDEAGAWPSWVQKAIAVVAVATAVVAATAITIATYGAGSVAGVAMITAAATLAAKATEVAVLQVKKGESEGKSGSQIAQDVVESLYDNGSRIIGLTPVTKSAGIAFTHSTHTIIEEAFGGKQTLSRTLYSTGGKVLPYFFAAIAWAETIRSTFFCKDPLERANERGYILK